MVNIFFEIHSNLPREGPGANVSTKQAFLTLQDLTAEPRILDVGCGPGMQTIMLAKMSNGKITALDNHQPFLDYLKNQAIKEGVSDRISLVNGDMRDLKFDAKSFDLIWAEGAIFIIGFEKGIRDWRRLLADKGYLVVSELCWLKDNPPEEIREYFAEGYQAIKTIKENLEIVRKANYRLISNFVLPDESWWNNYYTLIASKIPSLRTKYSEDEEALAFLDCEELEMEMFRKYSKYYGYVFYIMQVE